jgi:hypothetical protein
MNWLFSERGQAVVDLSSATLSLVAILIAVAVALVEQRRFHDERQRELNREREADEKRRREQRTASENFLRLCIDLIQRAEDRLEAEVDALERLGASHMTWTRSNGIPHDMAPYLDALEAMRAVPQGNPDGVLGLSRAVWALKELVYHKGNDTAPPRGRAVGYARGALEDLRFGRSLLEQIVVDLALAG